MNFSLTTSLLFLLHRASQVADDIFAGQMEFEGLTSRQFVVLAAISVQEGASQTDITELTGIDRSTLTDLVGRLQSKGLVSRSRAQHDARSYEVRLTTAGRNILEAALPLAMAVDDRLTGSISQSKQREFTEILQQIVANGPSPLPGRGAAGR